jgi:hypothetical protein
MIYNLDFKIKDGDESYVCPEITAIDVKNADKYFNTDHYNRFLPDDFYFNDLKMFEPVYEDIVYDHFNDYQFWAGESPLAFSVPVSQKFRDLFERFDLAGCKFYAGDLNFKGEKYPFNVFHYLDEAWFEYIDLEKTIFCEIVNPMTEYKKGEIIKIESIEDFYNIEKKLSINCRDIYVGEVKRIGLGEIHLKQKKDFIYFPELFSCVSERLKNAIEEAGLTGIEFKAIEHVDFYCNGEKL